MITASLQIVSDLQLQQISLDDYTEAFSQVSLHFEEIEQAFVRLTKTHSEEELFYQIQYIPRPLHRCYLSSIFGAAIFKSFRRPEYLFMA